MEDSLLLEGNGYYCHCSVFEVKPGAWEASVLFERKSDHATGKTLIDGKRHKLSATLASRDEAMQAVSKYALDHAARDDTGL